MKNDDFAQVARLVGAYHRLSIALFLQCGVGPKLLVQDGLGHHLAGTIREDHLVTDIAGQLPNACKVVNRRFSMQGFAWHVRTQAATRIATLRKQLHPLKQLSCSSLDGTGMLHI